MATFDWNTNWTDQAAVQDYEVFTMFWNAVRERKTAIMSYAQVIGNQYPPAVPSMASITDATAAWASLQKDVWNLRGYFVRPDAPRSPDNTKFQSLADSGYQVIAGQDHFTRKYVREIWSLDNPGQQGQVAHFAALNRPNQTPPRVTPPAERVHSGKLFRYTSGAWLEIDRNTEPNAAPDIIIDYGLARPDDLLGPWILNQMRDLLNKMIWTVAWLRASQFNPQLQVVIEPQWVSGTNSHYHWAGAVGRLVNQSAELICSLVDQVFTATTRSTAGTTWGQIVRSSNTYYVITSQTPIWYFHGINTYGPGRELGTRNFAYQFYNGPYQGDNTDWAGAEKLRGAGYLALYHVIPAGMTADLEAFVRAQVMNYETGGTMTVDEWGEDYDYQCIFNDFGDGYSEGELRSVGTATGKTHRLPLDLEYMKIDVAIGGWSNPAYPPLNSRQLPGYEIYDWAILIKWDAGFQYKSAM